MNRLQLQTLSAAREHEASTLLEARLYSGSLYLMGYAVECALKACIARMTQRHEFPDKTRARVSWTHDLEVLARTAGLWGDLTATMESDLDLSRNWTVVSGWSAESRYELQVSDHRAHAFHSACTDDRAGVLSWIRGRW